MSQEKFDLQIVHGSFERSLAGEDDVFVDAYLEAFKELYKFFSLMGTVFGFVSSDVKEKVEYLEKLRKHQDHGEQFESVQKMMDYERDGNLRNKKNYVSGCRTLLRLHRRLNFIYLFLKRLGELETANANTCAVCQSAYNEILAQFHPLLIRKGAVMVMYAMPNRSPSGEGLRGRVAGYRNAPGDAGCHPASVRPDAVAVHQVRSSWVALNNSRANNKQHH